MTGAATSAHAQFGYSATSTTNFAGGATAYVDLGTTGTAIATANTDDANSAAQNIGFTFNYNGAAFTQFVLNTNGFIELGATAPAGAQFTDGANSTINGPLNSTDANLILPFNQDLTAGSAGGTEYRVVTTGTAPNRVCTIQWKNVADKPRLAGTTTVATQYANFSFQVKLYETSNQIDFVYGTATAGAVATDNPKFITVGIKGTDGSTAQAIVGTKSSVSPWSGTLFSAGAYAATGVNAHNIRGTVLPDPGRTYRFTIQVPNDAAANNIQGYGSMAVPVGNPFSIRGQVSNAGNTSLAAFPVTLTISGANTYTQTVNATALAVNGTAVVNFTGISLTNVGANTVTISVPSDGNNTNNSFSQAMQTSATDFSFIAPGVPQTSSYGFSPAASFTSAFCGKFTVNATRAVTAVRAVIGNDVNLVPNAANSQQSTVVFGVVVDATTGALLGRSPDYTITAADLGQLHTFTITSPPTVPAGSFLVGLAQVVQAGGFQVYPMAYQAENPARTGLFYSASISSTNPPTDNGAANNARFMLEAVTSAPANNDIAVNEIQGYGSVAVPAGNPFSLRAVVRNAGAAAITTPTVVTLTISGANTFTQTQTATSLAVGATSVLTFTNISLPNAGANTVTVTVPNDDVAGNNSVAQAMTTSPTKFSFIAPGVAPTGAFGVPVTTAARTIAFCSKLTVNTPRDITAVRAFIYNDTNLSTSNTVAYGVVVNATTGALIGRSADYTLTTADLGQLHTFGLTANVPAGDFLVGVAFVTPANSTAVFPLAVQDETPARPATFYTVNLTTTTPTAPVDAASNNSRYMIEAETSAPNACPTPTGLTATGSTPTSASFSFTAAATATGYQIIYGAPGFTPGGAGSTTSPTFTGTTYTLAGLSPSTTYDFYIQTICSATSQSGLGGPVRVTTACTPPTIAAFPYTQNFDAIVAGQTLPCGITVTDSNNDGFTWRATSSVVDPATTSVARSAPNAMVYSYNNVGPTHTVAANDWFFTPALSLTTTQAYRLSFYYRVASTYTEALEVKYGAAATPAGQTNLIYNNPNMTSATYVLARNASTPAVLDITPATAGNYYVGFHAISQADQGFLAIDDLSISAGPLATSEALKRAVSVFPNPSNTGVFNLEIHGANAKQAMSVEVTNMLGQRVYTGSAKDNFSNSVNLSSLASGIYSIKVRNGEEYTQQQISIVK
ncbi:hypothetical protein GCM10028822_41980 [Hymenobacter terrigena]